MSGSLARALGPVTLLGLFLSASAASLAGPAPELRAPPVQVLGDSSGSASASIVLCGWRVAPSQLVCEMTLAPVPDFLTVFVQSGFVGTVNVRIQDVWNSWFAANCHIEAVTNPPVAACTTSGPGVFADSPSYLVRVTSTIYSNGWYNGGVAYN